MVSLGIHVPSVFGEDEPPDRLAYYRELVSAGAGAFDTLWVSDHLQKGADPITEAWVTLSYLGGLNPGLRLGHMVLGLGYRNPALVAKMAATLQWFGRGQFTLGLGAGWQEDEYASYGYPFPGPGTRIEQLGEAIDLIRTMWRDSPATFEGRHFQVREAYCEPRPNPAPRILVGGQGPKLVRLAAEKADAWTWDGPLELFGPPHERLLRACQDIGRDVSEIARIAEFAVYMPADVADFPEPYDSGYLDFKTIPLGPTADDAVREIARLTEVGVSELCLMFWDIDSLRRFRDEVVPRLESTGA
jgi:alkanesulfonate monooxygenase SsuD/methylene tetrahydromethanopterin reductase-like flavin-dependent oxidoreductase (luciferase family)